MSALFIFIHLPIGDLSLRDILKLPWSLWLNLCLKLTARLRDLADSSMCGVQRVQKIMLYTIAHSELSKLLLSKTY